MDAKNNPRRISSTRLGGNEGNIVSLVYCATRLRFVLNDSIVDEHALAQISGSSQELSAQVVNIRSPLWNGDREKVHDELAPLIEHQAQQNSETDSLNPVQRAVKSAVWIGKD